MSNVTLYGFPRSTFVKVCGLILTARNVNYQFHDTEDEMYLPVHLERHPFAVRTGEAGRQHVTVLQKIHTRTPEGVAVGVEHAKIDDSISVHVRDDRRKRLIFLERHPVYFAVALRWPVPNNAADCGLDHVTSPQLRASSR